MAKVTDILTGICNHVVGSFSDMLKYNKTATLIVIAISFVAGAILF